MLLQRTTSIVKWTILAALTSVSLGATAVTAEAGFPGQVPFKKPIGFNGKPGFIGSKPIGFNNGFNKGGFNKFNNGFNGGFNGGFNPGFNNGFNGGFNNGGFNGGFVPPVHFHKKFHPTGVHFVPGHGFHVDGHFDLVPHRSW